MFVAACLAAGSWTARSVEIGPGAATWTVSLGERWSAAGDAGEHRFEAQVGAIGGGTRASTSSSYRVDAAPPLFDLVGPSDGVLDPRDPRVVVEIDDGPDGAGFGGLAVGDALAPSVEPAGAGFRWTGRFVAREGRPVLRIEARFDPSDAELAGAIDYRLHLEARDALGHIGEWSHGFRIAGPAESPFSLLGEEGDDDTIRCRYRVPVRGRVELPGRAEPHLAAGESAAARLAFADIGLIDSAALVSALAPSLDVATSGPVTAAGARITDDGLEFTLDAGAAVHAPTPFGVVVEVPRSVDMQFSAPRAFAGGRGRLARCPPIDPGYRWEQGALRASSPMGPEAAHLLTDGEVTAVEPSVDTLRVALAGFVIGVARPPHGRFEYDPAGRRLVYLVEQPDPLPLVTTASRATLSATGEATRTTTLVADDGGGYRFVVDEVEEGSYRLDGHISALGVYALESGTTSRLAVHAAALARGPPPRVSRLRYDYGAERIELEVADEGTAAANLEVELTIGSMVFGVRVDANGTASIPLPQPAQSTEIRLTVRDRAGQQAGSTIAIEGAAQFRGPVPGEQSEDFEVPAPWPSGVHPLGTAVGGRQAWRRICPARCAGAPTPAAPRSGEPARSVSLGGGPTGALLIDTLEDPARRAEARRPGSAEGAAAEAFLLAMNRAPGRSSAAVGVGATSAGSRPAGPVTCRAPEPCGPVRYRDVLAPRIDDLALVPERSEFGATLSDHGAPITDLRVQFDLRADQQLYSDANTDFRLDPATGRLSVRYGAAPGAERTRLDLRVTDRAHNRARALRTVLRPRAPPAIDLRAEPLPDRVASTALHAEISDDGGIDDALTELTIDAVPCPAVRLSGAPGARAGTWFCRAVLDDGTHRFAASARDRLGLTAHRELEFEVARGPRIERFVHRASRGTDSLAAVVRARGRAIDAASIALVVDGARVRRFDFDAGSGLFAATLPALAAGRHTAVLRVRDDGGVESHASVRFLTGAAEGALALIALDLFELEGGNGDGLANPGELVRVTPMVVNRTGVALPALAGTFTALDVGVEVERGTLEFGDLAAGDSSAALPGAEMRIAPDLLDREGVDRKEIPIALDLQAAGGRRWRLDGSFVVDRPRASFLAPAAPGAAPTPAPVAVPPPGPVPAAPSIEVLSPGNGSLLDFGVLAPPQASVTVQGAYDGGAEAVAAVFLAVLDGTGAPVFAGVPGPAGAGLFAQPLTLGAGTYSVGARVITSGGDEAVAASSFTVKVAAPPANVAIDDPVDGSFVPVDFVVRGSFDTSGAGVDSFVLRGYRGGAMKYEVAVTVTGANTWQADAGFDNPCSDCELEVRLRPVGGSLVTDRIAVQL